MPKPHHKPTWTSLFTFFVLVVVFSACVYMFSYPAMVKWKVSRARKWRDRIVDGADMPFYKPADWVIDNTPLSAPLYWWADMLDVEWVMRAAALERDGVTLNPPISPM